MKKAFGCEACTSEFTPYGPALKSLEDKRDVNDKLKA